MASDIQREKISSKETELEKARREARIAMEGERHKKKREFDQKVIEQRELLNKKLAEQKEKDHQEKKELTLQEAEEKRTREQEARKREAIRIDKIVASKEEMQKLKSSPTVELSSIRTLKSDLARANKSGDLSMVKIMMKQQREEGVETSRKKKSGRLFLAGSFLSLATIIIIAGVFWWDQQPVSEKNISAPTPTNSIARLSASPVGINTDQYESLYVYQILPGIIAEAEPAEINQIYFYNATGVLDFKTASQQNYFELPDEFLSLLTNDSMIGFDQENKKYFFIFKTNDRQNLWLHLLENENEVVGNLFGTLRGSQTRAKILNSIFESYVVDNIDTRQATSGQTPALGIYGFIDQDHILIAEDELTFSNIESKYRQN